MIHCDFETDGKNLRCRRCKRRIRNHGHARHPVRTCVAELNAIGHLLASVHPGDAVAALAKVSGAAMLAELWEQASGKPCGCQNRRQWLNERWRQFVWDHFSAQPNPAPNALPVVILNHQPADAERKAEDQEHDKHHPAAG